MKRILILCFLFIASNTIFAQETATKKKTTTAKTELSAAEKEAKQKICPFLKENCKGSMCLSWKKVGKLEWQKILRIKAEFRLSRNEKTILEEIEEIIEYEVNKLSQTKIELEEVFRWLERTNTRFKTVIEKLEPGMNDKELEVQEGYCILLKGQ